jgi:hypothetical protein
VPWKCPTCERQFRNKNQAHSCIVTAVQDHWHASEENVRLTCEKLLSHVKRFGDIRISPVKNGIMVASASTFLAVKPKKKWVDIEFIHDTEINEHPIHKTVHYVKTKWAHFLRLDNPKDVNRQLMGWLKSAYESINKDRK